MVSPLWWAGPWSAVLLIGFWQTWTPWPVEQRSGQILVVLLALASAWSGNAAWAVAFAVLSSAAAYGVGETAWFEEALSLPLLMGALLRARLAWLPQVPGSMALWAALLALVLVCIASQGLLVDDETDGDSGRSRRRPMLFGQFAWALFGLCIGSPQAPLAWTGMLGLAWQQPLLRLPLASGMERSDLPPLRTALLFLGLGGCVGLSGFSAYFQLFWPLMSQAGAGMQAKLADSAGWLTAVGMLAVLVQTSAFGYFYWRKVLPQTGEMAPQAPRSTWAWLALGLSLAWALRANHLSGLALRALQAIQPELFPPSS